MRRGKPLPRWLAFLLFTGLLAFAGCDQQPAADAQPEQAAVDAGKKVPLGKGFDFYVLSLSWSPSYCEAEGENANRQQCASGRPYAFVVHGLWPQFERGFPQDCGGNGNVDNDTARSLYDLMPSAGLIRHEWRKHGTCTGLSQADYFQVLRFARERVVVPQEFRRLDDYRTLSPREAEQSFLKANPGLDASDIAVTCDRRFLREIRICMTKDLGFRECPEIDRRACRADRIVMPPMRGG
ncbi:ribonuclease T2 family protein [Mesorhizobium sp. ASY16-5R]|uniref:ribonuclease T2 family protein n=1 Tax=Mesorhizobium sp. ASY16-5R TaxID=3445772 RepID=UPI003F9EF655